MALIDGPLDPRILLAQVDDVELIDPRRHEQERPLNDLFGARIILDQFHHLIAEDDLAGSRRDVLADHELIVIGLTDPERALAPLQILEQVLQSVDEVLAAGLDRRADNLGVGHREIRRRHGADELAGVEVDLFLGLRVDIIDLVDALLHPARGQQVRLLDIVENVVLFPGLVLEPLVVAPRLDDRFGLLPHHPAGGVLPQRHVVLPK